MTPREFFGHLVWLDGRPLLDTVEPYRLAIFEAAFSAPRRYNTVLCGRAKKNWKTADLVLAALYCLLLPNSPQGNDCFIIANDEDQANDDLSLAKKLIVANPILSAELDLQAKGIYRNDGRGALRILPARDAIGLHGKTYAFLGIDEMHGYRNYDVLEALARDPTRPDALIWITTYASIYNTPGAPLFDYFQRGVRGADPRMLFSWYSADVCTDPSFAELPPEQRANPSAASWGDEGYLTQQRVLLPSHRFRRLHLNLPGMVDGAYFDPGKVQDAIAEGRRELTVPVEINGGPVSAARFVDMSGGSADFAVFAEAFHDARTNRIVLSRLVAQTGRPPFNPRDAVTKFAALVKQSGASTVTGDRYGGNTFASDFSSHGISYSASALTKHQIYEAFEPLLNAGRVELLDVPELREQLLGLVMRGQRIDHLPGEHDDYCNAACGAVVLASRASTAQHPIVFHGEDINRGLDLYDTDARGGTVLGFNWNSAQRRFFPQ